jgi:beta-glucosidase
MEFYRNPVHPPEARARDLLNRMTLDEKIAQLGSITAREVIEKGRAFAPEKAGRLRFGIGQISRPGGGTRLRPVETAQIIDDLQRFLRNETRLGIPALVHEECLAGYPARGATMFPQIIGLAATFEPDLARRMADVLRMQLRALNIHQGLAPVLDVTRDPRWGRIEETFGEDPYLVATMGKAYIEGLRGTDRTQGVMATLKHFAGYGASEGGCNCAPAHIPQREFREVYLFPFEASVRSAGAQAVMSAYHEVDGIPCSASGELLTSLLRTTWGFDGIVVSDYASIPRLMDHHHLTSTKEEAGWRALEAGIDIELPTTECFNDQFKELFRTGKAAMPILDRAVERILTVKYRCGLFEERPIAVGDVERFFDRAEDRALAREIATKSIVLLKNEHLLPLPKSISTLAVIGPNSDSWRNILGDYSYPSALEYSRHVEEGIEDYAGFPNPTVPVVTVLEGIRSKVSPATRILAAPGCGTNDASREAFARAEAAAREAECTILVVGGKSGFTPDCTCGEGRDRSDLSLPGVQHELVRRIHATGRPVVLVLVDGRPLSISWEKEHIPAIIHAWLPGEEGGNALADVLFGDSSPGGRMPVTVPLHVGQIPVYYAQRRPPSLAGQSTSYVEAPARPLYPFGHGLTYSSFEYSNLRVAPAEIPAEGTVTVSCEIQNTGPRVADEVLQLYVRDPVASVARPGMELKGFRRITVQPGATATARFSIPAETLAFFDASHRLVVEPGPVQVLLGSSSADIRLQGEFTIIGPTRLVSRRREYFTSCE